MTAGGQSMNDNINMDSTIADMNDSRIQQYNSRINVNMDSTIAGSIAGNDNINMK